ncbi:Spore germination protein GerE [compost metagenome]
MTAHFVEGTEGTDSGQGSHQLREEASLLGVFTPREREVAALLAQGATNKEIAGTLYISEAAVKKHLNAMLQKTGLKNRTQIAAAMLTS